MSKAKFKITQLAAKPIEVELVHPTAGPTGIFVKLCGPHSSQFRAATNEYRAKEVQDDKATLEWLMSCVLGWDEEAFEMPCTKENVLSFFSQPENEWVGLQIVPVIQNSANFFRPEGGETE